MCDYAGIEGAIVTGYTKDNPAQIGKMGVLKHDWNVIVIDGERYFLDVTWASGSCSRNDDNGKLEKFHKKLNNYYWLTPMDKLSRNHFPEDAIWLQNPVDDREKYKNTRYIVSSLMRNLDVILPQSGIINAVEGDTIIFKIKYTATINHLQINTNISRNPKVWSVHKKQKIWNEKAFAKQVYTDYKKEGDNYTFSYVVTNEKLSYIEVLFDHTIVLKFKVKIEKALLP